MGRHFRFRLAALAVALLAAVAKAYTVTEFSSTTSVGCTTRSGHGGTQPTPIPTSGGDGTITSTIRGSTSTTQAFTRISLSSTTTTTVQTSVTYTIVFATITSPTSTAYSVVNTVFATATWPSTVCVNGVVPKTKTVYSGTYLPISGQATTLPATYPTEVVCSGGVTEYLILHPVVTSGTSTETDIATSTVIDYTTTITSTITYATEIVYATTVTDTVTSYAVASTVETISTACQATYTTTYAAKCAPTNLIGAINNVGLVSGDYAPGTSPSYGPDIDDQYHHDPSLCCQLCQNNAGCGASLWGPGPGACGLYYAPANASVGGAQCGDFLLNFGTEAGRIAGESLVIQAGCGLVEYIGPEP